MAETGVSGHGRCCGLAWGECFGKVSEMINQELVGAYVGYITLGLSVLTEECGTLVTKSMGLWSGVGPVHITPLTSFVGKKRPSCICLPPSKTKTAYLEVPKIH